MLEKTTRERKKYSWKGSGRRKLGMIIIIIGAFAFEASLESADAFAERVSKLRQAPVPEKENHHCKNQQMSKT